MVEEKQIEPQDNIAKAEALATRLEQATIALKAENDRTEALRVQNTLGGESEAGKEPAPVKPETDAEYAARIVAGGKDEPGRTEGSKD